MRTMDFGPDLILGCAGQAHVMDPTWLGVRILSFVAWPDDERMRRHYLAQQAVYQIAMLDGSTTLEDASDFPPDVFFEWPLGSPEPRNENVRNARLNVLGRRLKSIDGGFGSLFGRGSGQSLDVSFVKAWQDAFVAGQLFAMVWAQAESHEGDLRDGPSLAKAKTALLAWRADEGLPVGREQIDVIWGRYRSVSHLVSAATVIASATAPRLGGLVDVCDAPRALRRAIMSEPLTTLTVADKLMQFGLEFRAYRAPRKHRMLDHDAVWRVPYPETLPTAELPTPRLPTVLLNATREHEARKR